MTCTYILTGVPPLTHRVACQTVSVFMYVYSYFQQLTKNTDQSFGCMVNTVMNPWQASSVFVVAIGEVYRQACFLAYGWVSDYCMVKTYIGKKMLSVTAFEKACENLKSYPEGTLMTLLATLVAQSKSMRRTIN